ncbi:uncharacterized protein LOC127566391 [Drosophila albomicans]|uniref:Uncharacterized protein LOC127566391 n=1 Tax=Drosophila albomicans TaxID=7291 RepID=A0A9C6TDR7_DROAB|nr:uncharacterized protein LOC127566391 [Drosophila albomicans]XP_051864458.1 uncharacterized protein LOC127566391 [Drosophila albomicans]
MSNRKNNIGKKQSIQWAKDSRTIVKLPPLPRQRSSVAPFYCRVIANRYVGQSLSEIMANNKPRSTPWLITRRNAEQSLEQRQRMLVNYRDANRTCILMIKLLPLGVLPVLTAPSKSYETNECFFVPWTQVPGSSALGKRYVAHDFQQLVSAGERYTTELANLVAETRSLLPRWLPQEDHEFVLPPPMQFADESAPKGHNPWMWRLKRNDTITLCNFPMQEDQPVLHKHAGRLPRKHPK